MTDAAALTPRQRAALAAAYELAGVSLGAGPLSTQAIEELQRRDADLGARFIAQLAETGALPRHLTSSTADAVHADCVAQVQGPWVLLAVDIHRCVLFPDRLRRSLPFWDAGTSLALVAAPAAFGLEGHVMDGLPSGDVDDVRAATAAAILRSPGALRDPDVAWAAASLTIRA